MVTFGVISQHWSGPGSRRFNTPSPAQKIQPKIWLPAAEVGWLLFVQCVQLV